MFIAYAVVLGVIVGHLLGGRIEGLSRIGFRWPWVAIGGLLAQIVLFSGAVDGLIGGWGPALYVASTAAVLVAVVRNLATPGLAIVAVGAVSNLAAILANGGYMPADPGALALAGGAESVSYSNSVTTDSAALRPLTDIFAIPEPVPLANVFSVGDVLIGIGVSLTIVLAMRRPTTPHDPGGDRSATVRAGNSPE
jgi:hypothetical protein